MKFLMILILCLGVSRILAADEAKPQVITIENHVFHPAEIHIPAHQKVQILVKNLDSSPEEFESGALRIEKVIAGKSEGLVHIRAVDHGHARLSANTMRKQPEAF